MTTAPVQTDWNGSGAAAVLNKPTWIPQSDPGYSTTDTTYTGGPGVNIDASNEISFTLPQGLGTTDTPTFAGISTSGGDINTANGAINTGDGFITSTGTVRGETVSFNVGQGVSIAVPTITNVSSIAFQGGSSTAITPTSITTQDILADSVESAIFKFGDGTTQTTAVPQSLGTSDSPTFEKLDLTSNLILDNAGDSGLEAEHFSDNRNGLVSLKMHNHVNAGGLGRSTSLELASNINLTATTVGTNLGDTDINLSTNKGQIFIGTQAVRANLIKLWTGFRTFNYFPTNGGSFFTAYTAPSTFSNKLYVSNVKIYHYVPLSNQSDDLYKSYEVPIGGATAVLTQLRPLVYKKHPSLRTDDPTPDLSDVEWFTESGFIAQDVEDIPELSYLVSDVETETYDETGETSKSLVYTDLIAWLVAGFQEQQTVIADLSTRLAALER